MTNGFYEAGLNFVGPDMSSPALSNYSVAELNVPFPSESWDHAQYPQSALYYVATGALSVKHSLNTDLLTGVRVITSTDHADIGLRRLENQGPRPDPAVAGRDFNDLAGGPVSSRRVDDAYQPVEHAVRVPVSRP